MMRSDDLGRRFIYVKSLATGSVPPRNRGTRRTKSLNPGAVRQLKGGCLKAVRLGVGFRAFWTLTFAPKYRAQIGEGLIVPGDEVRRFMKAMREHYRRRGNADFVYAWVAENPKQENPHVHLLTNVLVRKAEFQEYAAWAEQLWGFGWVNMQRIRKAESAGRYILKAVNYMAKGGESEQGEIAGNRYGMSRRIMPRYEREELPGYGAASRALETLQQDLGDGIEELGPGWLIRHGWAFPADTDEQTVRRCLDDLNTLMLLLEQEPGPST